MGILEQHFIFGLDWLSIMLIGQLILLTIQQSKLMPTKCGKLALLSSSERIVQSSRC